MMTLPEQFNELDQLLAERVCQWLNSDDPVLWQSVAATSYALSQGHSCLALDCARNEAPYDQLPVTLSTTEQWLAALQRYPIGPNDQSPIVLSERRLYLRRYWLFEQELAQFFQPRLTQKIELSASEWPLAKRLLNVFFGTDNHPTSTTDWQRIAAMNCLFNNTSVIIGGPGTGKTYTVTRILALLASLQADQPLSIKLAAPTGKAAQRMAEAISAAKASLQLDMLVADCIPEQAQTLHRLLGVVANSIHFRHNEHNRLDCDVLLIDEVSMVDLPLMTRLCRAIKPQTRLILLGDADQLPSVAAGSVLADLVQRPHTGYSKTRVQQLKKLDQRLTLQASDRPLDYATELQHSRRFDTDSGIGQLARQVISGNGDSALLFNQYHDLTWYPAEQFDALLTQWLEMHYRPIAQQTQLTEAFAKLQAFRILCATKEDPQGVNAINQRISRRLNPQRRPFYRGQPIMVTQNHYSLKLFNGDIGLVWPNEEGTLMAWFDHGTNYRAVALGRLPACETVYAMTIHKTQGSEFNHVALVLPSAGSQLLTRELLYTGLTRAKHTFSCVGQARIWQRGVATGVARWSGLASALSDSITQRN